jgi:DNA-binding transcriptional ArsR family regulator
VATNSENWTFLTNHAHVLLEVAIEPDIRMRDLAARVGITERATQRIITELAQSGYLEVERDGRRNRYRVKRSQPLRHPTERHHKVGELIDFLGHRPVGESAKRS